MNQGPVLQQPPAHIDPKDSRRDETSARSRGSSSSAEKGPKTSKKVELKALAKEQGKEKVHSTPAQKEGKSAKQILLELKSVAQNPFER